MHCLNLAYCECAPCDECVTVCDESSYAVNSIKESSHETLNHSNDSVSGVGDIAEFSDEEDIPAGLYSARTRFYLI